MRDSGFVNSWSDGPPSDQELLIGIFMEGENRNLSSGMIHPSDRRSKHFIKSKWDYQAL